MNKESAKNKLRTLLDKSSAYLKTDTKYLAVSGYWTTLSRIGFTVSGLLLTIGFANLLPPQEYGMYRYILTLGGIAGTFSLTGLGSALITATAKKIPGALRWGVLTRLKWSIGIPIVALGIAAYYFFNDNNTIAAGVLIAGTFIPLLDSFKLYNSFLTGRKEFKKATLYGFGRRLFSVAILLTALFLTNNIFILLATYFASNTFAAYTVYRKLLKEHPEYGTPDRATLTYSKHASTMDVFANIAGYADKILVFHFLGATPLAVYSFATAPVTQIQSGLRSIKSLLIPKLAMRDFPTLKKSLPWKAFLFFIAIFGIFTLYIVSAPLLYETLLPQYSESVRYSQFFAAVLLFVPLTLFSNTFVAHLKQKPLWILKTVLPSIKLVALVILLPLYGIWGAIVALLIERIVSALLTFFLFYRERG